MTPLLMVQSVMNWDMYCMLETETESHGWGERNMYWRETESHGWGKEGFAHFVSWSDKVETFPPAQNRTLLECEINHIPVPQPSAASLTSPMQNPLPQDVCQRDSELWGKRGRERETVRQR